MIFRNWLWALPATGWTFLQTTFMARRQLYGSSFKTVRRTFTFDFITSKLGCCQHAKLSIGYHQVFAFDTFKVIHLFSQTKVYQAAVVWRWWNGRWKQRWLASPQRCPPPLHTLLAAGRFKWMIFMTSLQAFERINLILHGGIEIKLRKLFLCPLICLKRAWCVLGP